MAFTGRTALSRQRPSVLTLVRNLFRAGLSALAGGLFILALRRVHTWKTLRRQRQAEALWRQHVDFKEVQACILTTEHLADLGRIEKRTLFVKPITEIFKNDYILETVLKAANKSVEQQDPFLVIQLSQEEKWHVLNTCLNHLGTLFAPYHVFFNEARRVESYYKSAWYCFTLTCAQTEASGRWFITPMKPVGENDDSGSLRIRLIMMNEQELRDMASGLIEPPARGFFNGRHESRWKICMRFAELFERQLIPDTRQQNTGCSPALKGVRSNASLWSPPGAQDSLQEQHDSWREDNSILRLHVPFPSNARHQLSPKAKSEECVSRDVVLYE